MDPSKSFGKQAKSAVFVASQAGSQAGNHNNQREREREVCFQIELPRVKHVREFNKLQIKYKCSIILNFMLLMMQRDSKEKG